VSPPAGWVALDDIPQGLRWATDHGAGVVNISMSTSRVSPDLLAAVRYALSHDVVVVASAGNISPGDSAVAAPASIPGVVAVAGTTRDGQHWAGSATGPQITVAAPSTDVETIASHDVYGAVGGYLRVPGGTSAAAPLVAGAAALVRAKYPHLKAATVIERLIATADDAGAAGRDEQYGYGRLNIVASLTTPIAPVQANPLGTPPVTDPAGVADGATPRRHGLRLLVRELSIAAVATAGGLVLLAGLSLAIVRRRRA
jgi:subtilisin family serine protease